MTQQRKDTIWRQTHRTTQQDTEWEMCLDDWTGNKFQVSSIRRQWLGKGNRLSRRSGLDLGPIGRLAQGMKVAGKVKTVPLLWSIKRIIIFCFSFNLALYSAVLNELFTYIHPSNCLLITGLWDPSNTINDVFKLLFKWVISQLSRDTYSFVALCTKTCSLLS